jgi:hypothetical protein
VGRSRPGFEIWLWSQLRYVWDSWAGIAQSV